MAEISPAPAAGDARRYRRRRSDADTWIVALGGNELNAGLESVARRRGARLAVVDWNEAPGFRSERHLRLDIKDTAAVLGALQPLIGRLLFAYTSADVATETAAQIHAAAGLHRPPTEALRIARDKLAMNAAWRRHGLSQKRFRECRSASELRPFHASHSGASIVKPVSGSSSRGITVIHPDDGDQLLASAWTRASCIDPEHRVIIEEYVHGTEFSVELVGDRAGNVQVLAIGRKYHSANAGRSRVATKLLYNPADLSAEQYMRIAGFARRCFRALSLHTSLGHVELILRPDGGLVPLELGARSGGFIATHLADAAAGNAGMLLDAHERVLRGGLIADETVLPRYSSMYFFYDFPTGVGRRSGTNLMHFTPPGIESLASNRTRLARGSTFEPIDSEAERHGFEILVGDPAVLTIGAVQGAESALCREFLGPE